MIVINKNELNPIVVTLTESPNYNNNTFFLFVFENKANGNVKYFQSEDITTFGLRYNKFLVNEDVTEDLLNATIHLTGNTQQLNYKIFGLDSEITTDADLTIAYNDKMTYGNPCEEGLVRVVGLEEDITINNIYL
jgi:hypothetical protein